MFDRFWLRIEKLLWHYEFALYIYRYGPDLTWKQAWNYPFEFKSDVDPQKAAHDKVSWMRS